MVAIDNCKRPCRIEREEKYCGRKMKKVDLNIRFFHFYVPISNFFIEDLKRLANRITR